MKEQPYGKALAFSLLFHCLVFGMVFTLHPFDTPPASAAPIAVDFVPASVIDTSNTLTMTSSSAALEQETKTEEANNTAAAPQPEGTRQVAVIENSYNGKATVSLSNTVARSENSASAAAALAVNKLVVRTAASQISGDKPVYPADAKAAGWEGTVKLLVTVGTDGTVTSVSVSRSSGYQSIDNAAVAAVWRWRFSPARRDGVAVESHTYVETDFNLDE